MRRLALGLTLLLGSARPVLAQAVQGRVVDLNSERPIAGATVTLVALVGGRVDTRVTDTDGRFQVAAHKPGFFRIEIQRVGSRKVVDGPFELETGQTREAHYRIALVPFQLDPIEVIAEKAAAQRFLREAGFYERQKSDFGKFVTRDQIEARKAKRFTDLLATVAGVRLTPGTGGFDRSTIRLRGSALSSGGACQPRVYLDGLVVIQGDARPWNRQMASSPNAQATEIAAAEFERTDVAIDDVVMPDDVEALEIYRSGAQVPPRFGGTSTATQCGVIVIWTRRGARPDR
jgi:hypothetical protein